MDDFPSRLNNAFQLLKSRGIVHTKIEFGEKLGMNGKSQIYDTFANRDRKLTLPILKRVADAFPDDISSHYMETGLGPIEAESNDETRPHYSNLPAAAGFMAGSGAFPDSESLPLNPRIGAYDYSVDILGDSMLPEIHSGDIAFCEILTDDSQVKPGKLYIVDTKEGAAIKVIAKKGKTALTLHSFNPDYPDYPVLKEDILKIARVVAIQRSY